MVLFPAAELPRMMTSLVAAEPTRASVEVPFIRESFHRERVQLAIPRPWFAARTGLMLATKS
jgi:hypothetical protein